MPRFVVYVVVFILALADSRSLYGQSVVRRTASRDTNNSLSVKIRNSLSVRSSATTSGNKKVYTEANVGIAAGSVIDTRVGGEDGVSTINLDSGLNTNQFEATGFSSEANYVLEESSMMNSQIEPLDEESSDGGTANASSDLVQETTLDIRYQSIDSLSTFQQAF